MLDLYIDADACPVKEEAARVAKRHQLNVTFVSNSPMRIPEGESFRLVIVEGHRDAADDWIAERVAKDDVVVTTDMPLAYRCVKKGARVLSPNGRILSEVNIGQILATRDLMAELREAGTITGGGPPPFQKKDRSLFLQSLEQIIQEVKRSSI